MRLRMIERNSVTTGFETLDHWNPSVKLGKRDKN